MASSWDPNQQPMQPGVYVPPQVPRRVVSRRKMGFILHSFHITMCICTMGLWTPVYMSGLRRRKTVTYM